MANSFTQLYVQLPRYAGHGLDVYICNTAS